jgi:transcriptional regulator with XRE-family HTH domain
MPRPPKHVPPETLGGRIRAARESLNLSLKKVAAERYSTSLISQIERNRVEPSQESLEFLAEKLHLPLADLQILANQQREAVSDSCQYMFNEEQLSVALELLASKRPQEALDSLSTVSMAQILSPLRWRLAAVRGQCYFHLRQFLNAQNDFLYAVTEGPEVLPADQHLVALELHLHLAATLRELKQPDAAFEQYTIALSMMDATTSLHYVAEAHWGMSLIAFERAKKPFDAAHCARYKETQLQLALKHAENACILYRSIRESLRAALLTCQIGLIEQESGKRDQARQHLQEVLSTWMPELEKRAHAPEIQNEMEQRGLHEVANVVSAAACSLAGIELETVNYPEALKYVQQAQYAGHMSYALRKAEAAIMLGRVLESINVLDPAAERAFRDAITLLAPTDRIAAQIRAHDALGRHLLKKGDTKAGEVELDIARSFSDVASTFSSSSISVEDETDEITLKV